MQQSDLQDYAEIGSTALSNLEQGKANISIDKLEKILEVRTRSESQNKRVA